MPSVRMIAQVSMGLIVKVNVTVSVGTDTALSPPYFLRSSFDVARSQAIVPSTAVTSSATPFECQFSQSAKRRRIGTAPRVPDAARSGAIHQFQAGRVGSRHDGVTPTSAACRRCVRVRCGSGNGAAAARRSPPPDPGQGSFEDVNTVGILGGMCPLATADFMRKLAELSVGKEDSEQVPLVVCADPRIPNWRSPPEPSTNGAYTTGDLESKSDKSLASPVAALLARRRFLEKSGAKCIVMPSHTAHCWHPQVAQGCSVPFLHIADALVEELKDSNLQPLEAGGRVKVGLLQSAATSQASFYQERLEAAGFEVVLPDKAAMEHAVIPGVEALNRRDMEGARNLLRIATQLLLVNAVNTVVLACHDMPTAFAPNDPTLKRCLDPMDALARRTVKWALQAQLGELEGVRGR